MMWHLMPSNNDLLSIAHQTIRADSRSYVIELHLVVTSVPTSSSTLHSNTRYVRGIRSLGSVVHGGQNHVERSGILSNGRKGRASTNQAHYQVPRPLAAEAISKRKVGQPCALYLSSTGHITFFHLWQCAYLVLVHFGDFVPSW
jgi:hypothetical protein